jgi:pimeloyl-ACP methyl ester carboxylesterase
MRSSRTLHWRASGPPDAPTIVFLHGVGVTGRMWHRHVAALSDYRCLAPDLPGHGLSRSSPWVSREETAGLIAQHIRQLPAGRAHVVGLSLGGSIAFEMVARTPDLVDHAVIDGCAAMGSRLAAPAKLAFAAISPFVRYRPVGRLLAAAVRVTDPAEVADMLEQFRQVDPPSFRRAFADAQEVRITPTLLAAPCPTLLVSGGAELAVTHHSARLLAARMPRAAARVMPGAGHGWLGQYPDVHIAMVRAWIEDRPLPEELETLSPAPLPVAVARPVTPRA